MVFIKEYITEKRRHFFHFSNMWNFIDGVKNPAKKRKLDEVAKRERDKKYDNESRKRAFHEPWKVADFDPTAAIHLWNSSGTRAMRPEFVEFENSKDTDSDMSEDAFSDVAEL